MLTCNAPLAPFTLWLIAIGTVERVDLHRDVELSRQIAVGDSEVDVLAILGEPDSRYAENKGFLGIFGRPRQWMYGTTINLSEFIVPGFPLPSPLPINIRWFSYDEDDLVIDWSRDGKVAKIMRPELHVPSGAEEIVEPYYFVADVVRFLRSHLPSKAGKAMALRDPIAIYNAASNLEAAFVCQLITAAGFEAHTVEDVSLVGIWMFGTLPEIHKPQVWVEREEVEQIKPLLEQYEDGKSKRESDDLLNIKVVCEDCEKASLYPASQLGAVETCPHCGAYVDVGDDNSLEGWEEGEADG